MTDTPLRFSQVLIEEYDECVDQGLGPPFPRAEFDAWRESHTHRLADLRARDPKACARELEASLVKEFYAWLHRHGVRRSALCLSGGGIRSATFGLGLVQGLASRKLLGCFDFLSTVSGGGYLGGWLSSWIYRENHGDGGVKVVEEQLGKCPDSPIDPDPEPVRHLRSYSRYMSPKLGLLSVDTWTLVAIFLRNLVLNWLVFLPWLAAVLIMPRISLWLVRLGSEETLYEYPWLEFIQPTLLSIFYWLAVILGSVGIGYNAPNWPSFKDTTRWPKGRRGQTGFLCWCLLPLLGMAVAITVAWGWLCAAGQSPSKLPLVPLPGIPWHNPLYAFVIFGVLLNVGGWIYSVCWAPRTHWAPRLRLLEPLGVIITGALGGFLAHVGARWLFRSTRTEIEVARYVCFAAPFLLLLFFLAIAVFVAAAGNYANSADREWMARLGGWLLIVIFVRAGFSAIVLFGPIGLLQAKTASISLVGGVSGLVTLFLGYRAGGASKQVGSPLSATALPAKVALTVAAPVFAVLILALLSFATGLLLIDSLASQEWLGVQEHLDFWDPLRVASHTPILALLVLLAAFLIVGILFGFIVDVNRFSLHGAYRDRLVRAYLGASRGERDPHPFTGFDPDDNVELYKLRGNRPFHLLNMAINLVDDDGLTRQDRKAGSFTVSPLHAGYLHLGYREIREYGQSRTHGADQERQRSMTLGTAIAISGAAVSPNMGNHSSPFVTFLLALFNIRLGWWLGNPGLVGETWRSNGPRFAPWSLFGEALGFTNERNPYVYLSDGGHFENLGLYEMVLRRCHFIVLSDAGADSGFTFGDLGNAVAKIRIDLGVPIHFEKIPMCPRVGKGGDYDVGRADDARPYYALGEIRYSEVDEGGENGWLLYIKPSLNGTEPIDVEHYARLHPDFPHESTSNQLYDEEQFESYRALGRHAMDQVLVDLDLNENGDLAALFKKKLEKMRS